MMLKEISGFVAAGLCLAVLLTAGLMVAAGQIYSNPSVYNVPQNAQDRADLYKALVSLDEGNGTPAIMGQVDPYGAMDNPYAFNDPQAALEKANAYKSAQKLNDINYGSPSGDNWYYWTNMWLNEP